MLSDERTVVLDTETTGLDANARIVEISVITVRSDVLVDTLLDPDEPIPRDATAVHGIGDRDVAGAPSFSSIVDRLADVLHSRRVVIYHAPYHVGRLRHELTGSNDTAPTAGRPRRRRRILQATPRPQPP